MTVATGAQATERIAEITGRLPSTVFHAARTMREADPTLWPMAGKGGGKGASHVEPHHLVNLAMALAIAEPITTAPKMVVGYRNMIQHGGLPYQPAHMGIVSRILFGPPATDGRTFGNKGGLGADLELLIKAIAGGLTQLEREWLMHSEIEVRLTTGSHIPEARLSYLDGTEWDNSRRIEIPYMPKSSEGPRSSDPNWNFAPSPSEAPIIRHSILGTRLFISLAELWNDTQHSRMTKSHSITTTGIPRSSREPNATITDSITLPEVDKSAQESKTAAIEPLPGNDAAALSDQPAINELDESSQAHLAGEKEKTQLASRSRAGRSRPFDRSVNYDRHRYESCSHAA